MNNKDSITDVTNFLTIEQLNYTNHPNETLLKRLQTLWKYLRNCYININSVNRQMIIYFASFHKHVLIECVFAIPVLACKGKSKILK